MKFIHIADIHLGARPDRNREWAKERELHGWQAFKEVIDKAKEEQVQLLLIAGDLFHGQPLVKELKEVNYQFSRIPQTQVALIAGNHDYLTPSSCYCTFHWEQNVHFLKSEEIGHIELEGLGTRIYGMSYWHREIREPRYKGVQARADNHINILLAHGGDEKHIPINGGDFANSNFDYVACGHIHKPMQLVQDKVVMAGALQPIDSNDLGEHGYFQGEIKNHACHVKFVPLHYCEYVPLNLKVSPEITQGALQEYVENRIRMAPAYQKFKVTLSGFCDKEAPIDMGKIKSMDRVVKVVNQCQADYDFEKLKRQYGQQILGRYIRALEEMPQNKITEKALYYGVEALMAE